MIITDDKIMDLIERYRREEEYFESMEVESAPSGEWDEYNIGYLIQQELVFGLEQALIILGIDYE